MPKSGHHNAYNCDLIVIGGGSGGLAAAKEAARFGAKVVLFDFVDPSPRGTKWGLGGTCVNVGCIPKKLMHRSARIGHGLSHDAAAFGWGDLSRTSFHWPALVKTIQNYIKSLNFSYKQGLKSAGVEYVNAFATLIDEHTVQYDKEGQSARLSAQYILIAVGGRPAVPTSTDVPGAMEYAITSDDLFSLKHAPGKTLVVGASYIALESAGFLTEFGFDTTVAVRSIFLRGFDRQCSEKVGSLMKELGTKFKMNVLPSKIEKHHGGDLKVTFTNGETDTFQTVMYATGRLAQTSKLGLPKVGVLTDALGKVVTKADESTSVRHIFAIGDSAQGRPELTPVAIKAGELLARRLFNAESILMDYLNIATTVFTPIEYGCCGLSEEDAIEKYGADQIETFLFEFSPIEASAAHWEKSHQCREDEYDTDMQPINMSKLVCLKSHHMQVVGYHCIGLNAGEMTQGYALAVKCGLTKKQFDAVVGIHPTDAESFHSMSITRRSGVSWVATGGCGGGKCG